MGKIDIDCWDENDLIVVDLNGQLDVYNSNDIQKLIDAYMQRGYKKFAVNLEKVTYLDSSTISAFIHCHCVVNRQAGYSCWRDFTVPPGKFLKWPSFTMFFQFTSTSPPPSTANSTDFLYRFPKNPINNELSIKRLMS